MKPSATNVPGRSFLQMPVRRSSAHQPLLELLPADSTARRHFRRRAGLSGAPRPAPWRAAGTFAHGTVCVSSIVKAPASTHLVLPSAAPRPSVRWGAVLLFAGSNTLNALNFVFNLWMARALGPHGYGVLVALTSLLVQLGLPAAPLPTLTSRFAALYAAAGDRARLRALVLLLGRSTGLVALAGGMAVVLAAAPLAAFLQLDPPPLVALLGPGLVIVYLAPIARGVLQGAGRFGGLATTMVLEGACKLLLGVALVAAGAGPAGGVGGVLAGSLAGTLLALWLVRDVLALPEAAGAQPSELHLGELVRYGALAACATGGMASLLLLDILLVKHYFDASTAGHYAALTVAGKILFWVSSAVPGVLYAALARARTASSEPGELDETALLLPLLGGVGALSLLGLGGFALAPALVVRLLFGQGYGAASELLVLFGLAMTLYALSNVLVNYFLARAVPAVLGVLALALGAEVGLIVSFHRDLAQVVLAVLGANAVLLGGLAALSLRERRRRAAREEGCHGR